CDPARPRATLGQLVRWSLREHLTRNVPSDLPKVPPGGRLGQRRSSISPDTLPAAERRATARGISPGIHSRTRRSPLRAERSPGGPGSSSLQLATGAASRSGRLEPVPRVYG